MSEIVLSILIGYIGHTLETPIKRYFDGDVDGAKLASYTTGGLLILGSFAIFAFTIFPRRVALQACSALSTALIGVGIGVVFAHVADGVVQ